MEGSLDLSPADFYTIIDAEIQAKDISGLHSSSMTTFYNNGLENIVTTVFSIERTITDYNKTSGSSKDINYLFLHVKFTKTYISMPTNIDSNSNREEPLFPLEATRKELTYKSNVHLDADIELTAVFTDGTSETRKDTVKNYFVSKLPIMVKSECCNLYNLPKTALLELGEDPNDPGGYFIIKGQEKIIDITENISYNHPRIFKTNDAIPQIRLEMISHPGEFANSDHFVVRFTPQTGELTVEIARDKVTGIRVPFYMLFRILGWSTDKAIFDFVLHRDYSSPLSLDMINFLKDAFEFEYKEFTPVKSERDKRKLLEFYANRVYNRDRAHFTYLDIPSKPENMRTIVEYVETRVDINFLPHIGQTPADRLHKAGFIANCIRYAFMHEKGIIPKTDRDSYANKRLLAAGSSFSKVFKYVFNNGAIKPVRYNIEQEIKKTPYAAINLLSILKTALHKVNFEKPLEQNLSTARGSSNRVGSGQTYKNRMSTQQLQRKNALSTISMTRTISDNGNSSNSTKQSERAIEMREQHPSCIGYTCLAQSPVGGDKVGLNKNCAITMTLTKNYSSTVMRSILLQDSELTPADKLLPQDMQSLYRVLVNGYPVGACKNPVLFRKKYVNMRRAGKFANEISVHYNREYSDLRFYTDSDRPIRPLIIVYNNERDPDKFTDKSKKWEQKILLTKKHIQEIKAGNLKMSDLVSAGVIEYIDASEQENTYICPRYEVFKARVNDEENEYTHLDIPQALFGIVALTSPYANHNEVTRLFYQSSQTQQTMGIPCFNWPLRATDKDVSVQYYLEDPLVKTIQNRYVPPFGCNAIVAIMCYSGYNVEDSQIANKASMERGLYTGCKLTNYKTTFENKEYFEIPDPTKCKSKANYHTLMKDTNLPRRNSILHEGDPMIPKIYKIGAKEREMADIKETNIEYLDKSTLYKEREIGIVQDSFSYKQEGDMLAAKVVIRKPREVSVGDKFSSRSGQKGVISALIRQSLMPFTESGMVPDIILNPHSFPSRMTIGQIYEMLVAKGCALNGVQMDGTIFTKVDTERIGDILEKGGFDRYGTERMYNPATGKFMDCMIYIGPTYYQRLQKFPTDQENTVSKGPTDALSHQPLDGKAAHGGIRFGEMERDILAVHGVTKTMYEKLFLHSDGYTDCICKCGKPGIVNEKMGMMKCQDCGNGADLTLIDSAWSPKLVIQNIEAAGFTVRRYPEPYQFAVDVDGYDKLDVFGRKKTIQT